MSHMMGEPVSTGRHRMRNPSHGRDKGPGASEESSAGFATSLEGSGSKVARNMNPKTKTRRNHCGGL